MKILLRRWNGKYYVWKNAEYKNDNYYICENDTEIRVKQTNILSIAEDNRANFVVCATCGAIVKNDPESIEAHYAEREAMKDCLKCTDMSPYGDEKNLTIKYTKNDDETYHAEKVYDTALGCGYQKWGYDNINSEKAKAGCKYYQCRKNGVHKIDDIFVKYPGIFNKQITIDLLAKHGFKETQSDSSRQQWYIDLGLRGNTLHAVVNELGIVEYFKISHRYDRYVAYYSEKYDKLFFEYGEKYIDSIPDAISQYKYNSAKKIIAALYKED